MNRRGFLAGVGVALSMTASGCSGFGDPDPSDIERQARIGGADQIRVEATPEREYEYLPERHRVRIEYTHSSDTMPFDEWGTRRAADHVAERLRSALQDKDFSMDGIAVGIGSTDFETLDRADSTVQRAAFERAVDIYPVVHYGYSLSRDGELLNKPTVDFDRLVSATPRSAHVTMLFPEQEYTVVFPILCKVAVTSHA